MAPLPQTASPDAADTDAWVIRLADVGRPHRPAVGSKAAELGHLHRTDATVPPGFCVTLAAFSRFVAEDDVFARHATALGSAERRDLAGIADEIGTHLRQCSFPADLHESIVRAWSQIGRAHRYVVRSSVVDEPGTGPGPRPGEPSTTSNLIGIEEIEAAIVERWCLWFDPRAVETRFDHEQPCDAMSVAVLVQRLVLADRSGVLWTAHPATGHRHIAAVKAVYGLGDGDRSASRPADAYAIHKRTQEVVETSVAVKPMATRARHDCGLHQVEVSAPRQRARVLKDDDLVRLVRLSQSLERECGGPQRIDWCFEGRKTFVVAVRPMAWLFPLPVPPPDDTHLHAYVSINHLLGMTDAMPPLACSAWLAALTRPRRSGQPTSDGGPRVAGGRVFVDVAPLLRNPMLRGPLLAWLRAIDPFGARGLQQLAARSTFARGPRAWPVRTLVSMLPAAWRWLAILMWRAPDRVAQRDGRWVQRDLEHLATLVHDDPGQYLVRVRDELGRLRAKALRLAPSAAAAVAAARWLRQLVVAAPPDFAQLARGVDSFATDLARALEPLANGAKPPSVPATVPLAGGREADTAAHDGRAPASPPAWDRFMSRYGARGPSELDPSRPRWRDAPQMLARSLAPRIESASRGRARAPGTPAEHIAEHMVAQAARTSGGVVRSWWVRRLIHLRRTLVAQRGHTIAVAAHALDHLRQATLRAATVMVARNQLSTVSDVWFLELPELIDAYHHPHRRVRGKVNARRADHRQHGQLAAPRVLSSDGECPQAAHQSRGDPLRLIGSPASHGDVVGRAQVVTTPGTERIEPGAILVVPFLDMGWIPLLLSASAVVVETGGTITTESMVTADLGIPAVVGVADATRSVRTGQRVWVDGTRGTIEIMDDGVIPDAVDPADPPA
ncbi:MAG: hypothetical protein B7733_02230 [Myxococcales bacterium FL481]|nr:MAG: hypothetical protein B7733_02230 [Myxococcales bacterium FL481]